MAPERLEIPRLKSSGGEIDPHSVKFLKPTSINASIEEMRQRYLNDGYLWVKGLLPREDVIDARRAYFQYLEPSGLIKPGSDLADGIYCGNDWRNFLAPGRLQRKFGLDENEEYIARMIRAHSENWYLEFINHPKIREFVLRFTGWLDTTMLQRSLLRPNVPNSESTQVHYDQIFLRAGPPTALTAWVPIGDCAMDGGGLLYLEDSVSIGKALEEGFAEAAQSFTEEEKLSAFNAAMMDTGFLERDSGSFSKIWNRKWLAADYEAGDVVFHDPFIIHSSATNEDFEGRIRLATDLRFVETGKPFDERWMSIWTPDDGL